MPKRILLGVFLAVFVALPLVSAPDDNPCPVDRVEKARYCTMCNAFLDGKACGKCKMECPEVDACLRVGYLCGDCGAKSLQAGDCSKCNKPLQASTVKALVIFRCPDCKATADAAGTCDKCQKDRDRTCSRSGTMPHVSK